MDHTPDQTKIEEMPDAFWRKVYMAVVVTTFVVITALWAFTKYFSS